MASATQRPRRPTAHLLIAASFAMACLPSWAAPGPGFDGPETRSGLAGNVRLFRLNGEGLKPLPDLMDAMAALPQSQPVAPSEAQADNLEPVVSDSVVSVLGPIPDGSLLALQDLDLLAQRALPTPKPPPAKPPTPVVTPPAPAPAVALSSTAAWTVVVVAGVAVAVLVATSGPTPPISR